MNKDKTKYLNIIKYILATLLIIIGIMTIMNMVDLIYLVIIVIINSTLEIINELMFKDRRPVKIILNLVVLIMFVVIYTKL
ncbi:hypothetical protein [Thermohalobacter berrensis]|uniref:Uncharacterized protein n=1 Tax=Thermohalobacter berrensis TaxID=99594 RepID=A0A419TA88_9FIRM|nr:hypothetical protein [Thermohalobacter berrensis]RKD34378.1 hypothetical protein BET03_00665 [Thermohalobacter berrensis]